MNLEKLITERLDGSLQAIESLRADVKSIEAVIQHVLTSLSNGGCLYTAGNGGSAAHAMHLAEELIGRYRSDRRPLPAVCLNADPTALTCIANDFGFENVFARQCDALVESSDVVLVLSTTGRSSNLVAALTSARAKGAATVGLLGGDGGACKNLCDAAVVVPENDSGHVQEVHQILIHMICEAAEAAFTKS